MPLQFSLCIYAGTQAVTCFRPPPWRLDKMRIALLLMLIALCANLFYSASLAKTAWPSFQNDLRPMETKSKNLASLPQGTSVNSPADDVPVEYKSFSGVWTGWACRGFSCSVQIAVTDIKYREAQFVYCFASDRTSSTCSIIAGKFTNNELSGNTSFGNRVTVRLRQDGNMDILWESGKSDAWVSGLLKRD